MIARCCLAFAFILSLAALGGARTIKGKYVSVTVGDAYFNVTSYGAKGDGTTDDTIAIQKAINAAAVAGGGTVRLPAGKKYLTTTLLLNTSKTALEIETGATLLVSNNRTTWPGEYDVILISSQSNVAITGGGVFEGQGRVWWDNRYEFRPRMVYAKRVTNMIISGITVQNCPNHCLQMYTDNIEIYGITVKNPPSSGIASSLQSHNTDGIDVHGEPFYVHDSIIDTGDDNVACHENNTLVEDCYFGNGHGASIGSLGDGTYLTNITFNRIIFNGTSSGARIKTIKGASGELWGVTFSNIIMYDVGSTIDLTMFYVTSSATSNKTTFKIHDITYRNITSYNADSAGELLCDGNSWCKKMYFIDVTHVPSKSLAYVCANITGTASGSISPTSCVTYVAESSSSTPTTPVVSSSIIPAIGSDQSVNVAVSSGKQDVAISSEITVVVASSEYVSDADQGTLSEIGQTSGCSRSSSKLFNAIFCIFTLAFVDYVM